MIEEDDVPDEWDAEDTEADAEADPWAERNARARERWNRSKPIGAPDNSWTRANTSDRETALKVLAFYAEHPDATLGRVAAELWMRPHEVLTARWLLVGAGMLRQVRGGKRQIVEGVLA